MNYLFSCLACLLLAVNLSAQEAAPTVVAPPADPQLENSLLWKISGNELTKPSYLYGTIHLIDREDFFLTDGTKQAIKEADQVTFEINLEEATGIGAQIGMMMQAFMKNGTTLEDLLSEEDYQMVDAHFSKMGLPLWILERIKPMFLSVIASMDMSQMGGGGEMTSYEMEIAQRAKQRDLPMAGLETVEYQMSMFDSIPYEAQAKMLVDAVRMTNDTSAAAVDELDMMTELYVNQNIMGMVQSIGDDADGLGKFEDMLLRNRNRNWIPVMGRQMQNQTVLFAVGAGHLAGRNGVINLLREAGYTVTPVLDVRP